jgi:type 1 glutamine amidotransferase
MKLLASINQLGIALLALFVSFGPGRANAAEPVVRVLIFSGQNNHNWRETTPKIKSILESSGRFAVEVTEHPEQCGAATFQKYDVLLSNWNTFGKPAVTNWPPAMRAAFLDFVRRGKGFVSVHAGSSSFYDWPEYQQLAGGSWKLGQTGHGPPHEFTVKLKAQNHPITSGLKSFVTTDELWHRTALQTNIEILATAYSAPEWKGTGRDELIAFTTGFGNGRGFNLLLGHDAKAMDAAGFQKLLCRGTEWAATGKVLTNNN